jgi:hypothetical protein
MSGDPQQCRLHAAECIRAAESAPSLETREEFIALAHISLRLAAQSESDNALPDAWSTSSKEYVAPFSPGSRRAA